jgi:hypothetical protein
VIRNPVTGALVDRPFPDFDAVLLSYTPNYSWQQFRSLQFLYMKDFTRGWGMNANYSYTISSVIRTRWNPTSDTLQFDGMSPQDGNSQRTTPRHDGRISGFVRLPFGITTSAFYFFRQGPRSDVLTGDFPLNASAPRVILSNGRSVADPFFNIAYPLARRYDVNMIKAPDAHIVNCRLQKSVPLVGGSHIELSGDVFNLFNSHAFTGFLSPDIRSSNFAKPTNYVAARAAQVGIRVSF